MKKKIIFWIIFILLAAAGAGYWMYQQSMFSKEILRLEILGPDTAKVGDQIEYTVRYKNNGNFTLQNPQLIFNMPNNSLTEDSKTMIVQQLKDIYPGDEEFVKIQTRLLGQEGDLKVAKASLSYTPQNLTVKYTSNTTFTTKIDTVPVTLDFDMPSNLEKGKDMQVAVNYFSNIDYPLENMSLKIDPVLGFDIKSSSPASLDKQEWKLPTLNKAQGGRVTITGNISGDANQNLNFSAKLGIWQDGDFIVIKQATAQANIIQPLLFISQQVNGSANYVASPGETLHYQIFFRNIGTSPFDKLFAVAKIDSAALDMSTIQAIGGQAQVNDNMIIWSWQDSPQLNHLGVQQEAEVDFSVKVKNDWNPSDTNGIVINDEVNISQINQKFSIKVNSGIGISQQAFYKSDDISNSGPVPPVVGKVTTYTISWNVKNYFSDTKNVKVKAVLPKNISLTGKILPEDEASNFSFDSASREIVWSVGAVPAGTGVKGDPLSLSFQVSFTPTASQKGSVAPLIGTATVSGENQFTNTIISASDKSIDTSLPDDFSNSDGGIVQ